MYVVDLRHFLDPPPDVPGPALRMAARLGQVVSAATAGVAGAAWVTAIPCERRPGRQPCRGQVSVQRTDVPPVISWRCTSCDDEGVIRGWERSPFDLRARDADRSPDRPVEVVVSAEVAATLRSLTAMDIRGARVVFRARTTQKGVVLKGEEDVLEELLDDLAAESNHEDNPRRRRRLDAAFEVINAATD